MPYSQLIDIVPMLLAALVILKSPSAYSRTHDPKDLAYLALALVYVVAQSSWVTAWLAGDAWGRDWANWFWAIFNSGVMGVILWSIYTDNPRSTK